MKRLQTGDIDYKEATAASAMRNKIEVNGVTAEENAAMIKVRQSVMLNQFYLSYILEYHINKSETNVVEHIFLRPHSFTTNLCLSL